MRRAKLDELIRLATAADDKLIEIERGTAEDIERIRLEVEATVRPVGAAALAAPGPPPPPQGRRNWSRLGRVSRVAGSVAVQLVHRRSHRAIPAGRGAHRAARQQSV